MLACSGAPRKDTRPSILLKENAVENPNRYAIRLQHYDDWRLTQHGPDLAEAAAQQNVATTDQELLEHLQFLWDSEAPKSWASDFLSAVQEKYP